MHVSIIPSPFIYSRLLYDGIIWFYKKGGYFQRDLDSLRTATKEEFLSYLYVDISTQSQVPIRITKDKVNPRIIPKTHFEV